MKCSLKKGFLTSVCLFALFVFLCGFITLWSDDYQLQQKQTTDKKTQIVQETNGWLYKSSKVQRIFGKEILKTTDAYLYR